MPKTLSKPKGKLYGPSIQNAWDSTEDMLPKYSDLIDGNSSGDNYIAYTFYSEEKVNAVMSLDSYIPLTDDVNLDEIVIDTAPRDTYDNEYDEAILTRDEGL